MCWTGIRISSKWESIDADQVSASEEEEEMMMSVAYKCNCIVLTFSNFRQHRLTSAGEQKLNAECSEKQRKKLREVEVC